MTTMKQREGFLKSDGGTSYVDLETGETFSSDEVAGMGHGSAPEPISEVEKKRIKLEQQKASQQAIDGAYAEILFSGESIVSPPIAEQNQPSKTFVPSENIVPALDSDIETEEESRKAGRRQVAGKQAIVLATRQGKGVK